LRDPLSGTSVLNGVPVTLSRCARAGVASEPAR